MRHAAKAQQHTEGQQYRDGLMDVIKRIKPGMPRSAYLEVAKLFIKYGRGFTPNQRREMLGMVGQEKINLSPNVLIMRGYIKRDYKKADYMKANNRRIKAASDYYFTHKRELYNKQMKSQHGVDPSYVAQVQEKEVDFRTHMQKIKTANVDGIMIAALAETMARALIQSYEAGIPATVRRIGSSSASNSPVPKIAGDAAKGVFFAAAYAAADKRPIARMFNEIVKSRYGINSPDHDFSQAYDLVRIAEIALNSADLKLDGASLAADRTAIRDAIASVKNYQGLASGPISFCAEATPQCRDGNRTAVLIAYTKGGENYKTEVLARVTMPIDFGL